MIYGKQAFCFLFALTIWGMTAFNPITAFPAGSSTTSIEEAKAAIEIALQAGAEKNANDDLTQARYWLAEAEREYARSQSLFSQSIKLVISDEAKNQEIQYLATMAKIKGQVAEAKARNVAVSAELKNAQKDLADYRTTLDVLNKELAEGVTARRVKTQAEAQQKELEEARKKVATLETLKQKELNDANLKDQQLTSQKAKQEAELHALQQTKESLDKTKAMLADASKIPGATVKLTEKEILITLTANNIFSSKDKIHYKGMSTLNEVAIYLKRYPAGTITVHCYADNTGKAKTNLDLTEKRAQKVKDYLVDFRNISADRIIAEGLGSSQPIADNNTASGRVLNRRIEIDVPIGQ